MQYMCIVGKNKYYLHLLRNRLQSKARQNLAFLPVSKAHTSKLNIFRQYAYISVNITFSICFRNMNFVYWKQNQRMLYLL